MKYTLRRHWLITLIFLISVCLLTFLRIKERIQTEIFLGVLVTLGTLLISIINYYRDGDRFFKELFTEFNSRYDEMNEDLDRISQKQKLDPNDQRILIDYFNLCSEEYMWVRKGRIPHDIWQSWLNGIKINLGNPVINAFFKEEKAKWKSSYYGFFDEAL